MKVKEPASCDNNHVFCRVCIAVWTSKNEHCPACRTPITSERPVRRLIGKTQLIAVKVSEYPAKAANIDQATEQAPLCLLFNDCKYFCWKLFTSIKHME